MCVILSSLAVVTVDHGLIQQIQQRLRDLEWTLAVGSMR
jgi:hypothetical protein